MASDQPDAMDLDVTAQLRILILLDITGSMSGEIRAVKQASAELVRLSGEEFNDVQLAVAIITFTEEDGCGKVDGSGCYVSLAEFNSLTEAQSYINNIKLSTPPDQPEVEASGDDSPENQKAALYRTVDLDPAVPTIAFLITDDRPHMADDRSGTASHERRWLENRGLDPKVASDIFRTFAKVLEHFDGKLVLNIVAYNNAAPEVYGSFAQRTGGMLMNPISRNPAVLARGLTDVVRALLGQMIDQPAEVQELEGFRLMDVSGLNPDRQTEQDSAGEVCSGDNKELFEIAMERMVAVAGSKFTKRAIGMTAPSEQLQFVWRAARYIFKASKDSSPTVAAAAAGGGRGDSTAADLDADLKSLLDIRQSILAQLPDDQKGHFTVTEADIKMLAEEAKTAAAAAAGEGDISGSGGSVSAVSLESVGDALADAADWEDWLAVVMRLLMGYPLSLQLPKDKLGNPDFMDCWSASMDKLGIDRTSAGEFMQLIGAEDTARGLTDKGEYNAFLILVEPSDKLASLVLRIASGTQVLNYVMGVLMGAPGFLPNMYAGIASSALLRMIGRRNLTEFEWSQAKQIHHSLATMHRNAARTISTELKMGRANPADHPSKLLLGAIRLFPPSGTSHLPQTAAAPTTTTTSSSSSTGFQALRMVLQEWLATLIQRHYGKSTPESDAAYLDSLICYIPFKLLGPVEVDPLQELHPLEQPGVPDSLQPDYQDQVLTRLRSGCKGPEGGDQADVPAHPVYLQFVRGARRLLALLLPECKDTGAAAAAAAAAGAEIGSSISAAASAAGGTSTVSTGDQLLAPGIEAVWPDWEQGLLQLLLLRWRTARYRSATTTAQHADTAEAAAGAAPAAKDKAEAEAATVTAAAATTASATAKAEVSWEPIRVATVLDLLLQRLREAAAPQLRSYKAARAAAATDRLVAAAADVVLAHKYDATAASAALQQLYLPLGAGLRVLDSATRPDGAAKGPLAELLSQQVVLQRNDVPKILQKCLAMQTSCEAAAAAAAAAPAGTAKDRVTPDMLRALVTGDWCTQGPQALRNASLIVQLCLAMGAVGAELLDAIRAVEKCERTTGFNKNGHSSELQYPGPTGFSIEYAVKRKAGVEGFLTLQGRAASERKRMRKAKRLELYLQSMYKFTEVAAWARVAVAGDEQKLKEVEAVLAGFSDANLVGRLTDKLESVLGQAGSWSTSTSTS